MGCVAKMNNDDLIPWFSQCSLEHGKICMFFHVLRIPWQPRSLQLSLRLLCKSCEQVRNHGKNYFHSSTKMSVVLKVTISLSWSVTGTPNLAARSSLGLTTPCTVCKVNTQISFSVIPRPAEGRKPALTPLPNTQKLGRALQYESKNSLQMVLKSLEMAPLISVGFLGYISR